MGKSKPLWKGTVNREYIKDVLRTAFTRMAKGNKEQEIGKATNDLEKYLVAELYLTTSEIMGGIKDTLDASMEFFKELAGGIDEEILKRRAQMMEDGPEEGEIRPDAEE